MSEERAAEPAITINGRRLSEAQAMTVRVAIETLASDLRDGLCDDEYGRAMTKAYEANISEIRKMICDD